MRFVFLIAALSSSILPAADTELIVECDRPATVSVETTTGRYPSMVSPNTYHRFVWPYTRDGSAWVNVIAEANGQTKSQRVCLVAGQVNPTVRFRFGWSTLAPIFAAPMTSQTVIAPITAPATASANITTNVQPRSDWQHSESARSIDHWFWLALCSLIGLGLWLIYIGWLASRRWHPSICGWQRAKFGAGTAHVEDHCTNK